MLKCSDLELGKTYACESCGLELKVEKACTKCDSCDCASEKECCNFTCCGHEMVAKS